MKNPTRVPQPMPHRRVDGLSTEVLFKLEVESGSLELIRLSLQRRSFSLGILAFPELTDGFCSVVQPFAIRQQRDPTQFLKNKCRHDFITQHRKLDVVGQTHTKERRYGCLC